MVVQSWHCRLAGWCGNAGIPPFSIMPRFAQFRDAVLGLDGPENSYTRSMTVPQQKNKLHNEIIRPKVGRNGPYTAPRHEMNRSRRKPTSCSAVLGSSPSGSAHCETLLHFPLSFPSFPFLFFSLFLHRSVFIDWTNLHGMHAMCHPPI